MQCERAQRISHTVVCSSLTDQKRTIEEAGRNDGTTRGYAAKDGRAQGKLHTKTELAKTKAEGRIRQERQNHDLILQKVRLEAAERRDTVLKAVDDGGKMLGDGLSSYLNDIEKLRKTVLSVPEPSS